jgi:LPS export ABC transporter protein LptC
MRNPRRLLSVFLFLGLLGCRFDYEEAMVDESLEQEVPQYTFEDFTHTFVQEGELALKIEASRVEDFSRLSQSRAEGIHFTEYDEEGEVVTEGWADEALVDADTENVDFTGSVYIYSSILESGIRAASMHWDRENRLLSTSENDAVRIEKEDGSFVEGRGFEADFKTRRIRFSSDVRGLYYIPEED